LEGCVEDPEKKGNESRLETVVELIGQAVFSWTGTSTCSGDSKFHLLK
jgi:hypothetical protein